LPPPPSTIKTRITKKLQIVKSDPKKEKIKHAPPPPSIV